MNIIFKYLFLGLSLCVFSLVSCQSDTDNSTSQNSDAPIIFEKLSPKEFESKLSTAEGAVLIDVRTPEEVAEGGLENAQNLNINDSNFKDQLAKIDRERPVFLYCRSGGRSGRAATMCKEMGFQEIYDMTGGYMRYSSEQ